MTQTMVRKHRKQIQRGGHRHRILATAPGLDGKRRRLVDDPSIIAGFGEAQGFGSDEAGDGRLALPDSVVLLKLGINHRSDQGHDEESQYC
jgi:hypothetical protein